MLAKISLGISVVLTALVVYLFATRNNNKLMLDGQEVQTAPALNAEGGPKAVVVAFINGDSLNEKYQFIVDKEKELNDRIKTADNKVGAEYQKRQQEVDELIGYAQSRPNLPADEKATIEQRLAVLDREIKNIQQREQDQMMKAQDDLQKELKSRVDEVLGAYAKQHGIDYVFNRQEAVPYMLYGNDGYDITNEVIALLNQAYTTEKAGK